MKELVSIILPVFNGEKFLNSAIESCIKQSYDNIELIVIDDCSTDRTPEIIQKYALKDDRISVLRNEKNVKLPKSLNIGHKKAKGTYITWTSHDNYLSINAIEQLVDIMASKNCDIVYSNYSKVSEFGESIIKKNLEGVSNLLFGNTIGPSFLYKRAVFERNQGYSENLFLIEDHDFWIRAARHSKFYHLNEDIYSYRIHNESLSSNIESDNRVNRSFKNAQKRMYLDILNNINYPYPEVISTIILSKFFREELTYEWIKKNKLRINLCLNSSLLLDSFIPHSNHKKQFATLLFIGLKRASKNNFQDFIFLNYYKLKLLLSHQL